MNRIPLLLTLTCLVTAPTFAQTKLAFDAASIKPAKSSDGFAIRTMIGGGPNGRYSAQGLTAKALILQAYGIQDFQVSGGPNWIANDRFDIEATPGPGITPTQAESQQMLQSLLEERFRLKVRQETKPMSAYILTAAKNGHRLKTSSIQPGSQPNRDASPGGGAPPPSEGGAFVTRGVVAPAGGQAGIGRGGPPVGGGMMRMAPGNLSGQGMTMEMLVRMLSNQLGRPITDQTGLTGAYDIELQWTPDRLPNASNLPPGIQLPPVDPNGADLFTALQEQLGLRLEATTQSGQALIIERIEKPSEN